VHDCYDWLKDIWLPLLTGGGSVVVGAVAIWVARRSHRLAEQVRKDEKKRDDAAALERYRDQLFRTVEPAVTALLELRAHFATDLRANRSPDRSAVARVLSRLNVIDAIASDDDRRMVNAVIDAFEEAADTKNPAVLHNVLGGLALKPPRLLSEDRDIDELVETTRKIVAASR
jgi:hypothetical protein